MIAKVSIINPEIIGEVSSQEQQELNYELLLTTIYKGLDGKSAYQIALEHGFKGTEEEWIASNKLAYKIVTELPKVGDSSIFYLIKNGENYDQYVYDNGSYVFVGDTNVNLDDYYTKNETYSKAETDSKLSDKVDKVNGKRLSTNDYTTEEKNKLANIQEFAEKNVQPNWDETDQTSDSFIRNKPELFSGDYNDLLNKPNLDEEISKDKLPISSETQKGIIQIASRAEVKQGLDAQKAVTPNTLKSVIENLSTSEISNTDNKTFAFSVSSKKTLAEITEEYKGEESLTNVFMGKDGLLIQLNGEKYFRISIDGERILVNSIADVNVYDEKLQTEDKSLIGAINELLSKINQGGGGTATVPDAVEDNVVTFATEGQLKDSGKKIGGEEFGEYEQIPIREVVGRGQYSSEAGKVYGYCVAKNDTYIDNEIVYKEKECVTAIGKIHYSAPYSLLLFNTEGDVNSGFVSSVSYDVKAGNNIVHYLNGERIIDANTIATEKGVENFLTTFNLVAPKFKTGDVVYATNVPTFHFGVMSWEEYKANPTNSMVTKMPIGLVVDPVKRTFLFCELLNKYFCNSDNIETYFGGYTSFDDGAEAFERISKLKGTSKAVDIPAFYGLRNQGMIGTIFYVKNDVAYVPALEEWRMAKEHLCTAFYGDDDSYAGFMDRLIALKNSIAPSDSLFIGKHNSGTSKLFYSQLSTVGKTVFGNGTFANAAFNMNGEIPGWDNAKDEYACCPVFGIYTEEEENA